MGWILFFEEEEERSKPIPHAWPDASTRITAQNDGFKLSSGGGVGSSVVVIETEEIEHTNDFQQVMMWLHPEDEDEGSVDEGEEP